MLQRAADGTASLIARRSQHGVHTYEERAASRRFEEARVSLIDNHGTDVAPVQQIVDAQVTTQSRT